jgi:hypothetical protein
MKQPKFKFGDKVTTETIQFVVGVISYSTWSEKYTYSSDIDYPYSVSYYEEDLQLYVEPPKTKKVYQFLFKLEGQRPLLRAELWNSEEDLRYHLAHSINARENIEYIKLANTFEVPE